jgi:hypothetical protein
MDPTTVRTGHLVRGLNDDHRREDCSGGIPKRLGEIVGTSPSRSGSFEASSRHRW